MRLIDNGFHIVILAGTINNFRIGSYHLMAGAVFSAFCNKRCNTFQCFIAGYAVNTHA